MAPLKERSISKAIAKIPTNVAVQIILTILILFCRVADSGLECNGGPLYNYTLSFENRMGDDVQGYNMTKDGMIVDCYSGFSLVASLRPNPKASYTNGICGGAGWFFNLKHYCFVYVPNLDWHQCFTAYTYRDECPERKCRWQLRKDYALSYTKGQYQQHNYTDNECPWW